MAVIAEMEEEEEPQQQPTTSAETGPEALSEASSMDADDALHPILVCMGPKGLLHAVVDFLRRRSDAFKSDSSLRDLMAILSAARDREAASATEQNSRAEKRPREDEEVPPPQQAAPPPAAAPAGEGKPQGNAGMAEEEDNRKKNLRTPNAGNGLDLEKYSMDSNSARGQCQCSCSSKRTI